MAHILCVLALLCFAACTVARSEPETEFNDLQLQQDTSSWLNKLQEKQESTKQQYLVDFLYKLSEYLHGPTETEMREKRRRGLNGRLTAQTRQPGCKFFFWKTLTAC